MHGNSSGDGGRRLCGSSIKLEGSRALYQGVCWTMILASIHTSHCNRQFLAFPKGSRFFVFKFEHNFSNDPSFFMPVFKYHSLPKKPSERSVLLLRSKGRTALCHTGFVCEPITLLSGTPSADTGVALSWVFKHSTFSFEYNIGGMTYMVS